ncbi:MAG: 3TM-type holin [Cyclobacteriaceae bacterium]
MSGLIKRIFSGGASELIGKVGEVVDNLVTSKEEREKLKQEMTGLVNEYHAKAQEELTNRLKIDMASDSWLSKNIRPLTLVFILVTYTLFSVTDENLIIAGHTFNIDGHYVELLGQWGKAIMYFYFGGRTLEKAVTMFRK